MIRNFIWALALVVWSASSFARDFSYDAKVAGMVCAYCAYSVSKKISALDGVEAASVDVDLEKGRVTFQTTKPIAQDELEAAITEAGFNLLRLTEVETTLTKRVQQDSVLAIDMKLNGLEPAQFRSVLEAVGDLAANSRSHLILHALEALEGQLLRPLLVERRQVIKVQFVPSATKTIRLQLFIASTGEQ